MCCSVCCSVSPPLSCNLYHSVASCCSALQCLADLVHSRDLCHCVVECLAVCRVVRVASCCSALQCVAVRCSVSCSALQCLAALALCVAANVVEHFLAAVLFVVCALSILKTNQETFGLYTLPALICVPPTSLLCTTQKSCYPYLCTTQKSRCPYLCITQKSRCPGRIFCVVVLQLVAVCIAVSRRPHRVIYVIVLHRVAVCCSVCCIVSQCMLHRVAVYVSKHHVAVCVAAPCRVSPPLS